MSNGNDKNKNIDLSFIDSFFKVFKSALRVEGEYKTFHNYRYNRGAMLYERYEELYDAACLMKDYLDRQK